MKSIRDSKFYFQSSVGKKMATSMFSQNFWRTKTFTILIKSQKSSKIFKPSIHNVVSARTNIEKYGLPCTLCTESKQAKTRLITTFGRQFQVMNCLGRNDNDNDNVLFSSYCCLHLILNSYSKLINNS